MRSIAVNDVYTGLKFKCHMSKVDIIFKVLLVKNNDENISVATRITC